MRIDVFLKKSRLIKQRSLAQKACEQSAIILNDSPVKPAKSVKVGDRITICYPTRVLEIKILEIPVGNVSKEKANKLYEVIRDERK